MVIVATEWRRVSRLGLFFLLFAISPGLASRKAQAAEVAENSVNSRLDQLEESVEHLEGELEILKAQNRIVIQQTTLSYRDQSYLKAGMSLLVPRARTFGFTTDTGLGAFVGAGKYFGRNNVADLALEWDFYPSIAARYRYEFHLTTPTVSVGPVIGYKMKMANIKPFDNFVEDPTAVKSSFFLLGMMVGFPIAHSMVTLEALYLFNDQAVLVANAGVHFFL